MAQDGDALFETLTADGRCPSTGDATFAAMLATTTHGGAAFAAATAVGRTVIGTATFANLSGTTSAGAPAPFGTPSFALMTATSAAGGFPTFSLMTAGASAMGPATFALMTATSQALAAPSMSSFSPMTAGGSAMTVAEFLPMTASASGPVTAVAAMRAMTASGGATGAVVSFELLTVAATAVGGGMAETRFTDFQRMEATGEASAGSVSEGTAAFEALVAAGFCPMDVDIAFEPLGASGTSLTGGAADGIGTFALFAVDAVNVSQGLSRGTGVFAYGTAAGRSAERNVASASAVALRMSGAGTSLVGSLGIGVVSFEEMALLVEGAATNIANAYPWFESLRAAGVGLPVLTGHRTWVVQPDSDALTEYQNYNFDALASFKGVPYGAGPSGIFRLDGEDDNGDAIDWSFRTGFMDDKDQALKRLNEILFAMRYDGPIRVRVWTDDSVYFDYDVANYRPDVVHQVRAKLGKGARSRFFRVEVFGIGNVHAVFHSMQLPMISTGRRIG